MRRSSTGRMRLRLRAREAGAFPPAEHDAKVLREPSPAGKRRAIADRLIAAARSGATTRPSPLPTSPAVPPAPRLLPATFRLLARPLPAPPTCPFPQADLSSGPAAPAPRPHRSHPALCKSTLPLRRTPKRAHPGAASPSHEEAIFVQGDDLDRRFRHAEEAPRRARRGSSTKAPSRLSWRPLSLRPTEAAPHFPGQSRRIRQRSTPGPPASAGGDVAGGDHCPPTPPAEDGPLLPIPVRPTLGRRAHVDGRLFPPPVTPCGLHHGSPAYGAWVLAQSGAAKRSLSREPDGPPCDRRVRQRRAATS